MQASVKSFFSTFWEIKVPQVCSHEMIVKSDIEEEFFKHYFSTHSPDNNIKNIVILKLNIFYLNHFEISSIK